LLKRHDRFQWTEEAKQALEDLKHHLQLPPILTAPQPGEKLLLYITTTTHIVTTTIMVERQEEGHTFGVQRPVYFISEVISESKVCYPTIQKLLYAILITSRKLHHYFDAYSISVVTNFPLMDILHSRDTTGCRCFTGCPPKGIPKVVSLGKKTPRSGTRRCKEHKTWTGSGRETRNTLRPVWWFVLPLV
jgi:hypothetical protein